MAKKEQNTWVTLSSEIKYNNPWIKLTEHKVLNPAGNEGIYGVVDFKNMAIGVLPLDEDYNTWLVGQWRFPLKAYSWEIPEGGGPLGIDPLESAKRELKEETGLIAGKYTELGGIHTSNSVCNESGLLYLAQDLTLTEAEPEESEDLQLKKIPFEEAYQMVMDGRITDSLSMVAILKVKIMIEKGLI
ncbi:NUDIX hydrolase [Aurantibacillus circumpalustris]|uniref:NUDIX hydrolase n=1 Tax=Aurantibacillus circumpalustris TaxID=3036359 RepID=UPI00295B4A7C|nr:NUDIX hydrolase [Aurantibacillus circumpalustris]